MPRIESKDITPEIVHDLMTKRSKYQPTFSSDWIGWKGKNTVFLADIPVGTEAVIYTRTRKHETLLARVVEIRETPQKGNEMVLVETHYSEGRPRTKLLAAGTAAIGLPHTNW